ncbi:tetratricopeptide repeat protein [Micromonospora sp. D93]|uniref:tetratricopeptide repeat protein n=1 Tax=Micromonospora sp. D93 TaxID=2824886 RepID=UPI001B361053|nr:tetratricopeptide repeat protein [Micromonospora sp. D93]MBQ1017963.1 tetratricopeptide repeat protein [Micromonospora sp. D93]
MYAEERGVGAFSEDVGGSGEAIFGEAMDRARAGDIVTAIVLFRQASDVGHGPATFLLGTFLKERGQLVEAEARYRLALRLGGLPSDEMIAEAELSLGYLRARQGDDREAEHFYRSSYARGNLDAAANLGNLLRRIGRDREAEVVYRQAAAGEQADAAYNLAELLADRGDLAGAEVLLRNAVAAGVSEAVNNLAMVRMRQGDLQEAEQLFRQAAAKGDHNAIFNLGVILELRRDLDEAETWLARAEAAGHQEAGERLRRVRLARHSRSEA